MPELQLKQRRFMCGLITLESMRKEIQMIQYQGCQTLGVQYDEQSEMDMRNIMRTTSTRSRLRSSCISMGYMMLYSSACVLTMMRTMTGEMQESGLDARCYTRAWSRTRSEHSSETPPSSQPSMMNMTRTMWNIKTRKNQ